MNHVPDPAFDPRIADWLEDDPSMAPREVLATVVAAIPSITQRRASRVPWRLPSMFTNRLAVAALATVLVLAIGGFALSRLAVPGPGGASPTPVATSSPTPAPTTAPSASPIVSTITAADVGRALAPGTYRVEGFAVPFTVTLPADWIVSSFATNAITLERDDGSNVNLSLLVIDKAYADPCRTADGPVAIEPGVDALVTALSSMPGFDVTNVTDATVGGAAGTSFRISNSIDVEAAGCTRATLSLGTYVDDGQDVDVEMFGGERDRFWVLDAGGTTILVAVTDTPAIVSGAQPVLDSLDFED